MTASRCGTVPCKTCPYRRDVPSGLWHEREYDKLPTYDGEIIDQLMAGATGLFMCHQQDGQLCAGWVGCHGARNLLAMRLNAREVHRSVWDYESPVPLFNSGEEACAHGKRDLDAPGTRAKRAIHRLLIKAGRRGHGTEGQDAMPERARLRRSKHHPHGRARSDRS